MRKYSDAKTIKGRFKYTIKKIRKGLIIVHIGNDVWKAGKINYIKNEEKGGFSVHQVIYGPDDKEYHLDHEGVTFITTYLSDEDENGYQYTGFTKNGNDTKEENLKIYILTHILDKKENWCFDLNIKPETNKPLKVIYDNGTVKNIVFNGEFKTTEINKNYYYSDGSKISSKTKKAIVPIAYRKF